ncbi:MAG: phenylalanine--tRNA ligase subunit beta [Gemmatimonadota bacterium]|nr:phenylalanine--tRNA ligase subunit beta [Gemmatimonadota bacterium]
MNLSYDWLREFVPLAETPEQLRDLITSRTATVDEVVRLRSDLEPIVVARVVEATRHPNADKLSITKVDIGGDRLLDVVCGAPNVQAGKLYPFAPVGTTMPDGRRIERAKIRGAVSEGMLCSARELKLGDDAAGILELDLDVSPGMPFLRARPTGDARLVIDVGANRPDLLSHLGIAREVAAVTGREFSLPSTGNSGVELADADRGHPDARAGGVPVHIEDAGLARRYMGVVIRGVAIGPSPAWLTARLEAVGARSINNVVDVTNYVLHELGQPMHAFDLAKLRGPAVVVRRARAGERLVTLDGVERALTASMPVIADAERAQALAGIMGGTESEVTAGTTDVFLEVASFNPTHTRGTRRALGLATDASYRFERGVDPALAPVALERAVRLITSLAGGSPDGGPADVYAGDSSPRALTVRVRRVTQVLGEPVPAPTIAKLLRAISFAVDVGSSGEELRVVPPTWRADILEEIDVVEEVARLRGYETFSDELRPGRPTTVPDDPQWIVGKRVRDALVAAGLLEARPMPFVAGAERGFVRVQNPLAENEAYLRREILDTLARRAEHNLAHREGNVRLFEIGHVFRPGRGPMPEEELRVACLVMGHRAPAHFTAPKPENFDEWDAKYLGELVARAAHPGASVELRPRVDAGGDGALWEILVDESSKGVVAGVRVSAAISAAAAPAYGVELSLGPVEAAPVAPAGRNAHGQTDGRRPASLGSRYRPLPTTPAAQFDLALLLRDDQTASQVETVIRRAAGELLESAVLFDLYAGKGVDPGHRSLAWRLTLRHPDRTLSSKEIDGRRAQILRALEAELGVRQRST